MDAQTTQQQEHGHALIKVGEILDNAYRLAQYASQVNSTDPNPRERLSLMFPSILSLIADGQAAIDEVM